MFPNNQNNKDQNPQPPPRNPFNNNGGNRGGGNGGGGPNGMPPGFDWRRWIWPAMLLVLLGWILLNASDIFTPATSSVRVPYSTLLEQARADNIARIEIVDQLASGTFRTPVTIVDGIGRTGNTSRFNTTLLPDGNDQLYDALLSGSAIVVPDQPDPNILLLFLFNIAPVLLIIGIFIWMARRTQRQMGGAFSFGRTQAREYTVERPKVTFDDVAGQDSAKQELTEVVDFLREPDKYIALGARIPRGVLLVGPPGTGKTLLARAVAGEAHVSFFSIAASEFVEMFVGVGASRVRDLFKRAKDNAPSIVFIDEIDAVGRQRGAGLGGGHDEREQTLNQMLAEMDGFDQTESVIVMAATNRPDVLDPALLRPGRFDRQVTVGLPDRKGREAILKIHTRGKPLDASVNLNDLARSTIGFSGADLSNLCNEAALTAARRNGRKISMRDFSDAFDRIVLGTESPPLSNPREREVVAYHEAGHAVVSTLTPGSDPVLKVTIVPRGQALGVTAYMPNDDTRNYPRSYLESRIMMLLGGRAAEQLRFGEVTTGAENDLRRVTDLTRRMVAQFGMSDAIGQLNFGDNQSQPFLGYSLSHNREYSEETAAKIDKEVRRIVDELYDRTLKILKENMHRLSSLANALLTSEVIGQEEMLEIIGLPKDFYNTDNVFRGGKATQNGAHHHADDAPASETPSGDAPEARPSSSPPPAHGSEGGED
jgi:cell division protease FtsH